MPSASSLPSRRTVYVTRAFLVVCAVLAAVELVIGNGWIGLFATGAVVLVALGQFAFRTSRPRLGTVLVVGGALFGGLMLVWTIVGAILALVLIVFTLMDVGRSEPPPQPA